MQALHVHLSKYLSCLTGGFLGSVLLGLMTSYRHLRSFLKVAASLRTALKVKSVCLSVCHLSVCLSVCHLSVCLSVCHLSVCLSVCSGTNFILIGDYEIDDTGIYLVMCSLPNQPLVRRRD